MRRVVDWTEAHGGFEDSDDYPFYDWLIEAWERLGDEMVQGHRDGKEM